MLDELIFRQMKNWKYAAGKYFCIHYFLVHSKIDSFWSMWTLRSDICGMYIIEDEPQSKTAENRALPINGYWKWRNIRDEVDERLLGIIYANLFNFRNGLKTHSRWKTISRRRRRRKNPTDIRLKFPELTVETLWDAMIDYKLPSFDVEQKFTVFIMYLHRGKTIGNQ